MTQVQFDERQNQILFLRESGAQVFPPMKVSNDDDALERALDQLESLHWFWPEVEIDFIACWQASQKGQSSSWQAPALSTRRRAGSWG